MTEIHEVSESTNRKIEIRDVNGALSDPDSTTITVWKPDGSKDIDSIAMTNNSVGNYSYWYMISEQIGIHKILYKATTSGIVTKQRDEFMAVAEQK